MSNLVPKMGSNLVVPAKSLTGSRRGAEGRDT